MVSFNLEYFWSISGVYLEYIPHYSPLILMYCRPDLEFRRWTGEKSERENIFRTFPCICNSTSLVAFKNDINYRSISNFDLYADKKYRQKDIFYRLINCFNL